MRAEFQADYLAVARVEESVNLVAGVAKNLRPATFELLLDGEPPHMAMRCEPDELPGALMIDDFDRMVVWLNTDYDTPADVPFEVKLGRTAPIADHKLIKGSTPFEPGYHATSAPPFSVTTFDQFMPDGFGDALPANNADKLQVRMFIANPAPTARVQVDAVLLLLPGSGLAKQRYLERCSVLAGER